MHAKVAKQCHACPSFINLCYVETLLTVQAVNFSIMNSRAVQTHSHGGDHHHNSHNVRSHEVAHGEEHHQHDHEKKSVLKKVKQKAKKIKDTLTKHGHHDHDHEHGHEHHYDDRHVPDDHDLYEEDEEDEEPEVHGAPMYDSAAVRSAAPGQGNIRKPGVNFGGTTVMGQEPYDEPRVIVVSPTAAINQCRPVDPTRTFVEVDKAMDHHHKVNLERPMHLEEDPHAPRSTPQAYAPANYQTKVTDPTGAGGSEIDITPVEKSFSRMTVHNEPKSFPQSKVLPTVAETHYPPSERHSQFAPEISSATNYLSAQSYGQYKPELSSEVKTQYPKSHDYSTPQVSTPTKTQYPSTTIHAQHLPQQYSSATKTQYPSSGSHDQFALESELPAPTKSEYPSTKIHDQYLPQRSSVTKAQYPSSGSHDQFASELPVSTEPKIQYPYTKISDQHLPQSATQTIYPSAGSHDQFLPEFSTQSKTPQAYNTTTQVVEPQYESNESSYTDKISSATSAIADKAASAKNAVASKLGYGDNRNDSETTQTRVHEENRSNENPSMISSATSAIADKAAIAKNAVASKLGYGSDTGTTQTRQQEENTGNENQSTISSATSAIADKAAIAKNAVASKLGYGSDTGTTQTRQQEENTGNENQSTISSTISSAASAISDKAATAKNAVASKLGYGASTESTQQEENTSNEKPSTVSSATSTIADKAITAKNIVAYKLGYGGETETNKSRLQQEENTGNEKPSTISSATSAIADTAVSAKNTVASKLGFGNTDNKGTATHEEKEGDHPTEYGKSVAHSLTEKLAPVYGKAAGVGAAVKSKVSGTEGEKSANVGVEQDKGVSVRDYLVDKLRPGNEDRALSEVISETLHKKEQPVEGTREGLDTSVRKNVSDAVHKREDEPERRVENPRVLGKVTESVEVKRRLGGEDEKTEKRYQEMYENSPGEGVVDKVKGMVGSLFTKTEENQSSQDSSANYGEGVEQVNKGAGERRLQESSN